MRLARLVLTLRTLLVWIIYAVYGSAAYQQASSAPEITENNLGMEQSAFRVHPFAET